VFVNEQKGQDRKGKDQHNDAARRVAFLLALTSCRKSHEQEGIYSGSFMGERHDNLPSTRYCSQDACAGSTVGGRPPGGSRSAS
jgi:hypothetical protein